MHIEFELLKFGLKRKKNFTNFIHLKRQCKYCLSLLGSGPLSSPPLTGKCLDAPLGIYDHFTLEHSSRVKADFIYHNPQGNLLHTNSNS